MKVYILTVGDEILIGQIVDTNAAWIAREMNLVGGRIVGKSSVADDLTAIKGGIEDGFFHADVVLMTGGLGPTKDDITKKAISEFFHVGMVFNDETYDRLVRFFQRLGRSTTESHKEQCYLPANAQVLTNRMGTAPGMWIQHGEKVLISMPGVPYEMQHIMSEEAIPSLKRKFPASPIIHKTLLTAGHGETQIEERIHDFEERLPAHVKLAYLPSLGTVRLRLTGKGSDERILEYQLEQLSQELAALLPGWVFGKGEDTLESVIGTHLLEQGKKMATAESCTGGLISHRITSIPGSSRYFKGSIVAYDNEVKMRQLGVRALTLEQFGAVSAETVSEMVSGVCMQLKVDVAIAVSGIAGPDGGTPTKPVGTIWVAVGNGQKQTVRKLQLGKDRSKNIEYTTNFALYLLWLHEKGYDVSEVL